MIKVDRWRERGTRARFLSGPVGRKKECKKKKRKEKKRGKEKNSQTRFTPAPEGNDSRFLLAWSKFVGEF